MKRNSHIYKKKKKEVFLKLIPPEVLWLQVDGAFLDRKVQL